MRGFLSEKTHKSEKLNKVNRYKHLDNVQEEIHKEIEVERTPVVDNGYSKVLKSNNHLWDQF